MQDLPSMKYEDVGIEGVPTQAGRDPLSKVECLEREETQAIRDAKNEANEESCRTRLPQLL